MPDPFRILYVDDEPDLLVLGKLFLQKTEGFAVDTLNSAEEALAILPQKQYDAIVSDYQMPGMDGIEFLKAVRALGNNIPFILFTGRGREEVVIQALNEGADFYLQKGGEPRSQFAELAHKVRSAVNRRRAEQGLAERESQLHTLINAMPDIVCFKDGQGRWLKANDYDLELFQITDVDYFGKKDSEIASYSPFYRDAFLTWESSDEAAWTKMTVSRGEEVIPRPDGSEKVFDIIKVPIFNPDGSRNGLVVVGRDITERKRAENALKESESKFRELSELLPQVVFETDEKGIITYANQIAFEMYGYRPSDLEQGLSVLQMIAPEDRERAKESISEVMKGGRPPSRGDEFLSLRKDGSTFPTSIYNSPVIINNKLAGLRGIIIDITERKRAEFELHERQEKFFAAFSINPDPVAITETETGTILEANLAFSQWSGYQPNELIGRTTKELNFWVDPDERNRIISSLAAQGEVLNQELRFRVKNGEMKDCLFSARFISLGGKEFLLTSSHDITERKRAEEELRAAYEQIAASEEEQKANFEELAVQEQKIRESEQRLRFMLGFYGSVLQPEKDILAYAVEGAGTVTGSPLGYLAFLNDDESELSMYAWSKSAMEECAVREKPLIYPVEKTGLWGEAVRERQAVITNDYSAPNPMKKGYPDGHPHIIRHMNVPILDGEHIVMVAGVANRESEYTENEVRQLTLLMQELWQVLKRRRAEETLRDSEDRLRSFIDSTRDSVVIINNEGIIVEWNPSSVRNAGISREEAIGRYVWDVFIRLVPQERRTEEHHTRLERMIRSELETGIAATSEPTISEIERPDGSKRVMRQVVFPIKTEKGIWFGSIAEDITDTIRAEEMLQKSEQLYRSVIENIQDVYYRSDLTGNLIMVSPSGADLLGYDSTDEILGKPIADTLYFDPAERGVFLAELNKTGSVRNFEARLRKKDGTMVYVSTNSHYYYADSGAVAGVEGIIRDVTERKQGEEALRESESRYRNFVRNATEGIYRIDFIPPVPLDIPEQELIDRLAQNAIIGEVNEYLAGMYGIRASDMIGRQATDFAPTYGERALLAVRAPGFQVSDQETEDVDLNGKSVFLLENFTGIVKNGHLLHIWGMQRDITESKKTKEEILFKNLVLSTQQETAPDGILIVDEKGSVLSFNKKFLDLWGIPPDIAESRLDETLLQFVLPNIPDPDSFLSKIHSLYETHEEKSFEEIDLKDGRVLERFSAPMLGKENKYYGRVWYFRDITGRKRSDRILYSQFSLSQKLQQVLDLRSVLDTCLDASIEISGLDSGGIYLTDPFTGAIDLVLSKNLGDEFVAAISHYPADSQNVEMLAAGTPLYIPYNQTGIVISGVKEREGLRGLAIIPIREEGKLIACINVASHTADEIPYEARISLETISAQIGSAIVRVRAEEALRESEEKYRSLVESSQDAIFSVDRNGYYQFANTAFASTLGYKPEYFDGKSFWDIYPRDLADMRYEGVMKVFETGQGGETEVVVPLPDRTLYYLAKTNPITDMQGTIVQVLVTATDITRRKLAEEALHEANKKLNLLSSITRHDINNKVSAQLGYLTFLQEMCNDNPELADYIKKVESAAQDIGKQIEFTRTYQDLGTHEPQWQDLHQILAKIPVPQSISVSNCCIDTEIFADVMLEKVFANIVDNAIRHGGDMTTITMTADEAKGPLMIRLEDDGVGIPNNEKEKIFERGYGKNTGLGLFLTREILAITGITIIETGEPGKGARFEIRVPEGKWRHIGTRNG